MVSDAHLGQTCQNHCVVLAYDVSNVIRATPTNADGKTELDLAAQDQREACRLMAFLVHDTKSSGGSGGNNNNITALSHHEVRFCAPPKRFVTVCSKNFSLS